MCGLLELHSTSRTIEDPDIILVRVDNLGGAVALEVEDGGASEA